MKYLTIIFFSLLILASCNNSEKNEKDYTINAYITGYFEGNVVLKKIRKGKLLPVDSLKMKKSKFKFKHVKIPSPEMFLLDIDNGNYIIQFFADPADIQVNADFNNGTLEVQGSETQKEFVSFTENNNIYENKLQKINNQRNLAYSNYDTLLLKSLDSTYDNVVSEQIDFIKKYAYENNKSFVSLYLTLYNLADYIDFNELNEIYEHFNDTLKISPYFKELKDIINIKKKTQAGMQAPDFSLPDTSGTLISLSSLQGKYVLLNFSASWSGYCRADNRVLKKIYEKYKNRDFEIYQISIEQSKKQWQNVIKADKINWITVSSLKGLDCDVLKLYGVRKLPYYFLLNKNGIIVYSGNNIKNPEKILNEILSE